MSERPRKKLVRGQHFGEEEEEVLVQPSRRRLRHRLRDAKKHIMEESSQYRKSFCFEDVCDDEKESSSILVDMGKIVGVIRSNCTEKPIENQREDTEEEDWPLPPEPLSHEVLVEDLQRQISEERLSFCISSKSNDEPWSSEEDEKPFYFQSKSSSRNTKGSVPSVCELLRDLQMNHSSSISSLVSTSSNTSVTSIDVLASRSKLRREKEKTSKQNCTLGDIEDPLLEAEKQFDSGIDLTDGNSLLRKFHDNYKKDLIYSNVGPILVSINPYKKIPLYTSEIIDTYRYQTLNKLPAHIYSLTERVWRNLCDICEDQCIIITGESGSGKTETSKLVLQYLTALTGHSNTFHNFKLQLLQANPILEAFGNAKTLSNDNSSRFGRYLEIFFDFKGDPVSALIHHYLLEKTRVTRKKFSNERNFHIFYQLLAGIDTHMLKELRLQRNLEEYSLLRCEKVGSVIDDKKDFLITKKSLMDLEFSSSELMSIYQILSAILKLGNVTFIPITNIDGSEGCSIANDYELFDACEMLQGEFLNFRSCFLTRNIEIKNESFLSDEVRASEAEQRRNNVCQTLYNRLFNWLCAKLNTTLKSAEPGKHKSLGLLDLYGFESLSVNGFEQLIINFSNEKLHELIIKKTLIEIQEEYIIQGIEWRNVAVFDNSIIVELIEGNGNGLLSLLDESILRSVNYFDDEILSEDKIYYDCILRRFKSHPHFEENTVIPWSFKIKHFAGTISYDVHHFSKTNRNSLDKDVSFSLFECDHPLMKTLFPEGNPKRALRRRPPTHGTIFKISMNALINTCNSKQLSYVRCIKPNEKKKAKVFDASLIMHQIRYLGLLETLNVFQRGFYFRLEYNIFLHRYKMLCIHTWPLWNGSIVEGVTYLLRSLPLSANEYQFGKTKLFIKTVVTVDMLEDFRRERLHELVTLIQKNFRGFSARKKWKILNQSQIVIATYWKKWKSKSHVLELNQYRRLHKSAFIIQKAFKLMKIRNYLLYLSCHLPSKSPLCFDWPESPSHFFPESTNKLLKNLYYKWKCYRYRCRFDQISRNRMREKVTASILFKHKKASYGKSVRIPFEGDYLGLRRNPVWRDTLVRNSLHKMDRYVVFADIVNKIHRSNGKFVPILFVLSTSSMLIMDQRTMQIKYRIPATEIYKLSLSPYMDDITILHVKASSPILDKRSQGNIPNCLSSESLQRKGDFVFQSGHVIEIVTKLFLVIQNATGQSPQINIATEFEANFGSESVTFAFRVKQGNVYGPNKNQVKLVKRGDRMEIIL